jgi:serine protease
MTRCLAEALVAIALFAVASTSLHAEKVHHVAHFSDETDRIIVKLRPSGGPQVQASATEQSRRQHIASLASRTGVSMTLARSIAESTHAVRVDRSYRGEELRALIARIERDPGVEYAAPDLRRYRSRVPSDPLYGTAQITQQWYLTAPSPTLVSPINAERAWDITTGSPRVVVAVLDSGVLFDHPDLGRFGSGGKLLPGYDFVGGVGSSDSLFVANDGDGRDADPSDPGDWVDSTDQKLSVFSGCDLSDSSWHGTHVAGIIGAKSNNGVGIAGIGWNSWILPVRVLGKCFGYDSDIIAGMRWAGGLSVPGAPANSYPARVINMSLGSSGTCTFPYLDAVAELGANNVLVVAAAGNDSEGASGSPANCTGVMSVTALRHIGTKVGFANWGSDVAIAAPGGNCINLTGSCLYPIVSAGNTGTRGPDSAGMTYDGELGTSFSTPMAAGVAGLMLAVHPTLNIDAVRKRLRNSARPFPAADPSLLACSDPSFVVDASGNLPNDGQCNCTTTSCGSGMLDAFAAVNAALNPLAAIAPTAAPSIGQPLVLDAGPSDAALGAVVANYHWSIVQPSSPGAGLTSTTTAQTSLTFSSTGNYTVRLDVTDSNGLTDTRTCTISVLSAGNVSQCVGLLPASLPADVAGITYDPATGLVSIPSVQVGSATYIDVRLMYIGNDTFALRAAAPQIPAGAALATYDPNTAILAIPSVIVNSTTYVNVTLQNIGGYTFKLLTATAQP